MTTYDPHEIRSIAPGYVGPEYAAKASDEDIIKMAKLLDEKARIYNREILPLKERITRLKRKYGVEGGKKDAD